MAHGGGGSGGGVGGFGRGLNDFCGGVGGDGDVRGGVGVAGLAALEAALRAA